MLARPRILFVCCHLRWPPISRGRRRELELLRRVGERFDVHVLVVSKTPADDYENAAQLSRHCVAVEVFAASPQASYGYAAQAGAPQVFRHRCPAATRRVAELLQRGDLDLIHVEGFYLMQHVPPEVEVPVLLVEQNIEYDLARQRSATSPDDDVLVGMIETEIAELRSCEQATRVATVTADDRQLVTEMTGSQEVSVVPDGADHVPMLRVLREKAEVGHPGEPVLALVANFAYSPNVDAALFLCHEVLPLMRARIPEVNVWLVGNAPPPAVRALAAERIRVTGTVEDVLPFLDAADAIACPLRIGGGIKVKVIEALRRGKAVISTSVGAQGLPSAAREALLIADDAGSFADRAVALLGDPARRLRQERRAAAAAAHLPTWDQAAASLIDLYRELLERDRVGPRRSRLSLAPQAGHVQPATERVATRERQLTIRRDPVADTQLPVEVEGVARRGSLAASGKRLAAGLDDPAA